MDDSWPASPRADELSDSISRHAAEIERTLLALEAVEAFRAEAAALRAELQAAKAQPTRRPAFRPVVPPELSPGAWRLMVESGFLVGVAVAAWAFRFHRLEIAIAMGAAWAIVAVIEAIAYRRSETSYLARPRFVAPVAAAAPAPAPPPPREAGDGSPVIPPAPALRVRRLPRLRLRREKAPVGPGAATRG